jgi:tRNA dimethylallyltransferase
VPCRAARCRRWLTPCLLAIVGPTATGKSALGIALARRLGGEVVACDSTAVYRGFDIGTDKVPPSEQQGVPHHLVDVADPTEEYSAARYAREAAAVIRDITARGRLPILVGGTGLYYRALTRGFFPGPGRDGAARAAGAGRRPRGVERLHAMLARVDPPSARASSRAIASASSARSRCIFLTGRPLTEHFAETTSPLPEYEVRLRAAGAAGRSPRCASARAWTRSSAGIVDEVRRCWPPASRHGASVQRSRVPAGPRVPARRARRGRDARAHRAREPPLRAPSVDLVQERA